MKKFFSLSNIIFIVSATIITALAICFSSKYVWIVWFSTIMGILSSKMASSGKWTMFIFEIISNIAYLQICLKEKYYGELILSSIIILISIASFMEWKNNQKNDIVLINKLKNKEIVASLTITSIFIIMYSYFLFKISSNLIILNTLSTVLYLLGSYYCLRRSILQFYSWVGYEISYILLWLLSGEWSGVILLVGGVSELIFDIVAIYNWKKFTIKQLIAKVNFICYTKLVTKERFNG